MREEICIEGYDLRKWLGAADSGSWDNTVLAVYSTRGTQYWVWAVHSVCRANYTLDMVLDRDDDMEVSREMTKFCLPAQLYVMCPGPGNICFAYSQPATSLRSLVIIFPLYYSIILTSTFATVSTDIPSCQAIHRFMPLHYYRTYNFRYILHTGFHELPLSDTSQHTVYMRDIIQIWKR